MKVLMILDQKKQRRRLLTLNCTDEVLIIFFFFLFHTKNLINTEGKVTFTNCTQNVCVCNKKQNEKNMDEL